MLLTIRSLLTKQFSGQLQRAKLVATNSRQKSHQPHHAAAPLSWTAIEEDCISTPGRESAYYLYAHFLAARARDRSELAWWPYSWGVIYIDLMHATSPQLDPGPILQTARRVSTAEGEGNRPGIRPDVSGLFHGTRRHLRLSGLLLKCGHIPKPMWLNCSMPTDQVCAELS